VGTGAQTPLMPIPPDGFRAAPGGHREWYRELEPSARERTAVLHRNGARSFGWDGHLLLLHHNERERRHGIAAWVRRGFERGDKVIYADQDVAAASEVLHQTLGESGLDAHLASRAGQLQVLHLHEFVLPHGPRAVVERALAEGYHGVRVSGETDRVAAAQPPGYSYTRTEQLIGDLCRHRTVHVLCQLPSSRVLPRLRGRQVRHSQPGAGIPPFDDIASAHGGGVCGGALQSRPMRDGVALSGEIDSMNAQLAEAVVRAAMRSSGPYFRLDLTGVTFMDIRGARAIANQLEQVRRVGGCLMVRCGGGPERVLRLLGFGELSYVTLLGGDQP
jgi:anti-anti-sigma factor